jgi:shikimate dehydrogenase
MSEKIFGVVGNPVLHSRSPHLFRTLFHALNVDACYTRISASSAEKALKTAKSIKLCGLNVTSPLKISMTGLLDRIDGHAEKINAVNTIVLKQNKWVGYNTDYEGVIQALESRGINPLGQKVIILGAGGAARAAAYAMKISHAERITIVNRTIERARSLSAMLGCEYASLQRFPELIDESDILISCIPDSLSGVEESIIRKNLVVMEANYKHSHPGIERKNEYKEFRQFDGLDWLFFQAIPAFRIFTGQKIPADIQKDIYKIFKAGEARRKTHIALIGFMGVGKTTLGQRLAEEMDCEFVDTDYAIERLARKTTAEIFEHHGEIAFRELEKAMIQKIFKNSHPKVVSFGGGAIIDKTNCAVIRENCLVIWIWASVQSAINRLDPYTRPLLKSSDPVKKAEYLMGQRKPFYARLADLVINSEQESVQELVRRIKDEMDQAIKS